MSTNWTRTQKINRALGMVMWQWKVSRLFIVKNFTCFQKILHWLPGGSAGREYTYNSGDPGSIPGSGRSPGEGSSNPLQYSCLENPMDGEDWRLRSKRSQRVAHNWATNSQNIIPLEKKVNEQMLPYQTKLTNECFINLCKVTEFSYFKNFLTTLFSCSISLNA